VDPARRYSVEIAQDPLQVARQEQQLDADVMPPLG
jgi:hypothetical protein